MKKSDAEGDKGKPGMENKWEKVDVLRDSRSGNKRE